MGINMLLIFSNKIMNLQILSANYRFLEFSETSTKNLSISVFSTHCLLASSLKFQWNLKPNLLLCWNCTNLLSVSLSFILHFFQLSLSLSLSLSLALSHVHTVFFPNRFYLQFLFLLNFSLLLQLLLFSCCIKKSIGKWFGALNEDFNLKLKML